MKTASVFDWEFLCIVGSQSRFWCGAQDPDPVIAQTSAAKLGRGGDFPLLDTYRTHVRPGAAWLLHAIDPYFTEPTGITDENILAEELPLHEARARLNFFSEGAHFWSWGKDELNMLAISCYVAGIPPSIPAHRFDKPSNS